MKSQSYMTRALRSSDPRFARILRKLGYPEPTAPEEEADDDDPGSQKDPLDHDGDGRKGGVKPRAVRTAKPKG